MICIFLPSKVYLETDVELASRRFDLQCFIIIVIIINIFFDKLYAYDQADKPGLWFSRVYLCGEDFLVSFDHSKLRFLGQNFVTCF